MSTIQTSLRHYATQDEGVVWINFYLKGEKVHFSTKVAVKTKHWNQEKGIVLAGDKFARDKNLVIESVLSRVNDVFVRARLRNKTLTRESFFRQYNRPTDFDTFYEFVQAAMKRDRNEDTTRMVHMSIVRKLQEYAPRLGFDDITHDFLDAYYLYLRKECGNNDNTALKNMTVFKKYVRAAWKQGYMDENPFEEWHIRKVRTNCTYLDETELARLTEIYRAGVLPCEQHKTLEFFLFLCFSSLHVGDARQLRLEQFSDTSFTYFRQKLRNRKPEPIVIPISAPLHNLIRNIAGVRRKGLLFEHLPADQTMNRYLKEIAAEAEIEKSITHKVGRHTFATHYLRKTKDLASLREILGHSDISETLIYAHVLDESKQEGVRCFDQFVV